MRPAAGAIPVTLARRQGLPCARQRATGHLGDARACTARMYRGARVQTDGAPPIKADRLHMYPHTTPTHPLHAMMGLFFSVAMSSSASPGGVRHEKQGGPRSGWVPRTIRYRAVTVDGDDPGTSLDHVSARDSCEENTYLAYPGHSERAAAPRCSAGLLPQMPPIVLLSCLIRALAATVSA